MSIEWTEDWEIGIQVIDEQHHQIVDYINALEASHQQNNRQATGEVLADLVNYTISHFAFEEDMMQQAGYSFASAHGKVHKLFVRRVEGFQKRFDAGEDIAEELLRSLQSWLKSHIQRDDRDYAALVKQQLNLPEKAESSTAEPEPEKQGWFTRVFGKESQFH